MVQKSLLNVFMAIGKCPNCQGTINGLPSFEILCIQQFKTLIALDFAKNFF